MVIVIMGVTGCGKTTVGQLLAAKLTLPFLDADDFHSKENILKMNQGIPLLDDDRKPWLLVLSNTLKEYEEKSGVVLACSALRESYRKILQSSVQSDIIWIHLEGSQETILERLKNRKNHFMSPDLLTSQMEVLESPAYACNISIEKSPEGIVSEIIKEIRK